MSTAPAQQLQFTSAAGYVSQLVSGSTVVYTIEPTRPYGYTTPQPGLTPTLPPAVGKWRAGSRDQSVPVDQQIAVDLGIFQALADAQTACQIAAQLAGVNVPLTWLATQVYQSRALLNWTWIYNISVPGTDPTGQMFWRALKRDSSLIAQYQESITIGNYTTLANAMAACQNDLAVDFPTLVSIPS